MHVILMLLCSVYASGDDDYIFMDDYYCYDIDGDGAALLQAVNKLN